MYIAARYCPPYEERAYQKVVGGVRVGTASKGRAREGRARVCRRRGGG